MIHCRESAYFSLPFSAALHQRARDVLKMRLALLDGRRQAGGVVPIAGIIRVLTSTLTSSEAWKSQLIDVLPVVLHVSSTTMHVLSGSK
jgi:hypothetical protein